MKRIMVVCDSCGKKVSGLSWSWKALKGDQKIEKDLCDLCMHKVFSCIYGGESSEQDFSECFSELEDFKPAGRKYKKLDMGKVMALRDAGWSKKQIAEEMGVSEASIASAIYRHKKKESEKVTGK